jgi:hypothetical protein
MSVSLIRGSVWAAADVFVGSKPFWHARSTARCRDMRVNDVRA